MGKIISLAKYKASKAAAVQTAAASTSDPLSPKAREYLNWMYHGTADDKFVFDKETERELSSVFRFDLEDTSPQEVAHMERSRRGIKE